MWNFFCTTEQQSAVLKRAPCTVYYQSEVNTQHARSAKRRHMRAGTRKLGRIGQGGGGQEAVTGLQCARLGSTTGGMILDCGRRVRHVSALVFYQFR